MGYVVRPVRCGPLQADVTGVTWLAPNGRLSATTVRDRSEITNRCHGDGFGDEKMIVHLPVRGDSSCHDMSFDNHRFKTLDVPVVIC